MNHKYTGNSVTVHLSPFTMHYPLSVHHEWKMANGKYMVNGKQPMVNVAKGAIV